MRLRNVLMQRVDARYRGSWQRAVGVGAAALAVTIAIIAFSKLTRTPLQKLSDAETGTRPIEARIAGFRWAPFERATRTRGRSVVARRDLHLVAAASAVLLSADGDETPSGKHGAAVARLVLARVGEAVASFDALLVEQTSDPRLLNDDAAAHLTLATEHDRPQELPAALAAAERALRIDPRMPEAMFNRALILDRLGLSRHANAAWRRFLAVEGTGPWADEARAHLATFKEATLAESYRRLTQTTEAAAIAGDTERLRAIVNDYRQEARTTAEAVLGQWAEAELHGDSASASRSLNIVRAVGGALKDINGDDFLVSAVRAIDDARSGQRTILIQAHAAYHHGRMLLSSEKPTEAEPLLGQAARDFGATGSPMAFAARYFQAVNLAAMHRGEESYQILKTLESTVPAARFRALDAQIHWDLGLAEVVRGNWSAADRAYRRAAGGFASLGERGNLGFVNSLQAEVADYLGDREDAWRRNIAAFPLLTEAGRGNRLQVAIGAAARAELRAGFPDRALPLFDLEIEETAFGASGSVRLANAYARRAMLYAQIGDRASAEKDLTEARMLTAKLADPQTKNFADGTAAMTQAILVERTQPRVALALLARAKDMYLAAQQRLPLPRIDLERARSFAQLGQEAAALDAYSEGIEELERQRQTVQNLDKRVGVFDAGQALFIETIALLARRGEAARAFAFADRARALTLVESTAARQPALAAGEPASVTTIQRSIPPATVIIEYAVLPGRLAVFTISRERLDVTMIEIGEQELRDVVNRFATAVRGRAPMATVQNVASRAYEVLVKPVAGKVRQAETIVFVPDRFLQLVPFAALHDGHEFIIEDHALIVSPGAQLFVELNLKPRERPALDALIFGNPSTAGELDDLRGSEQEAREVAAAYTRPIVAIGGEATRDLFFASFGNAAVVHFAGHASTDPSRGADAALAFAGRTGAEFVQAYEVARTAPRATRLVVLAACDTFAGTREHFEGTPTLAHAFLAAGVPSVVGTLWPIEDAASETLFRNFHRLYRSGLDSAGSLRQAQLELLRSNQASLRHPAAWSAAEVLGSSTQYQIEERGAANE